MNTGERLWWIPIGQTPTAVSNHPMLRGRDLGETGGGGELDPDGHRAASCLRPRARTAAVAERVRQEDRQEDRHGETASGRPVRDDVVLARGQAVRRGADRRRTVSRLVGRAGSPLVRCEITTTKNAGHRRDRRSTHFGFASSASPASARTFPASFGEARRSASGAKAAALKRARRCTSRFYRSNAPRGASAARGAGRGITFQSPNASSRAANW